MMMVTGTLPIHNGTLREVYNMHDALMQRTDNLYNDNSSVLSLLSQYLNTSPDFINIEMMEEMSPGDTPKMQEYAFAMLLSSSLGLNIDENLKDRRLFEKYLLPAVSLLDANKYMENPYYKNIIIPDMNCGSWKLTHQSYKPYEAFVWNDLKTLPDGRIIPRIGFFKESFSYPAVLQDGREWMTITPNEIETMEEAIASSHGRVLTFGLGLGYFAYMASEKKEVSSVTVVERDSQVLQLFKEHILPQFQHKNKILLIHQDAFEYAEKHMKNGNFDLVFTDLWHDPSDGIDLYLKMKQYEHLSPESNFMYWIEKTLACYI